MASFLRLTLRGLLLAAVLPVAAMARTTDSASPNGNSAHPTATRGTRHIAAVPVITALSPSPSGLGQIITLTGTDLGSVTALTVNGVTAFTSIASNTATGLTFRVPASTPATGAGVVLTTAGGTATYAFTLMAAPGNALDFVKTLYNEVKIYKQQSLADFTVEFWMNTTVSGQGNSTTAGSQWYSGSGLVDAEQKGNFNDWGTSLIGNKVAFGLGNLGTTGGNFTIFSTASVVDGRWHHVAAVRSGNTGGTTCTMSIYIDGVLDVSNATCTYVANRTPPLLSAGGPLIALGAIMSTAATATATGPFYTGRLDEVRLWSMARSATDIQNNYRTALIVPQTNLISYYNFDAGTPSGTNTGLTTLYDLTATGSNDGYLGSGTTATTVTSGFTLTGNASNWVESYAMVVPTATAATSNTNTSFTANWTAPSVGVVNNYLIDVSTSLTFAPAITGSPFSAAPPALSQSITGLTPGATYYYRIRADKTTPTTIQGQGGQSNVISIIAAPPSTVSSLSALTLSAGSLAPTFASGTTGYSLTTGASTTTVTPTVTQANATVKVNGVAVVSGTASAAIPLAAGSNTVTVVVTAQDGVTTTSYTVAICATQAVAQNITLVLDASGNASTTAVAVNNGSTTGCTAASPSALSLSTTAFTCANVGSNTVTLTVTDASSNVSQASAIVTVQDNVFPIATAQNVSVAMGANGRAYVLPSTVNNGSSDLCGVTTMALSASTFGNCGTSSSALAFNGGGGYVALPALAPATLASMTSFTFEAWVNYVDNGVWSRIMDIGYGTAGNFMFLSPKAYPSQLAFYMHTSAGGDEKILSTSVMPSGWHHLAVTLNRTSTKVIGTMYLDGAVVGTNNAMTLTPSSLGTLATTFNYLGRSEFSPDPFFSGQLDEVRIWNTARTAVEINTYKDKSVDGSTAGLLAYYDLNDGTGSTTVASRGSVAGAGTLSITAPPAPTATGGTPTFVGPGQVPAMSATGPQTVTLTVSDRGGNVSTATAIVTVTQSTDITWTGAISTDWTDCRNWTFGKAPDATTSITIPTGLTFYPNLTTGTLAVQNMTINTGGSLTMASGATLQVSGNFTNNGTATLPGTVAFVGGATQTISGSTATSFSTLTVNNTAGTVQLTADLPVTTALTFTAGTLTTGAFKVALGSTATLSGESETSYIIGNVEVTHNLATAGTADNFGSLGLTLTPNSSSTALPGSTLVRRVTGTPATGVGSSTGVTRYFVITPAVNTGLNVAMDFAYFNHELNSIPTANLAMYKTASGTTGPWAIQRPATLGTNLVSVAGITDFSVWTLGNTAAPLPVELSAFTATADGPAAVRLAWATATEKNSAAFGVERSTNGETFNNIGTVPAMGSSSSIAPRAYTLTDQHMPTAATTLYYRLRLVDADGTAVYSPVRAVALIRAHDEPAVTIYPNPAHSAVTLNGTLPGTRVQVLDALGRQITAATADDAGTATLVLPLGLAKGMYVVRAGPKAVRLTVE